MALLPPHGIVLPGVRVLVTLEAYEDAGEIVCLFHTLTGKIELGPKAWLQAIRDNMQVFERIARNAGCTEMRIEGRDWGRVLKPLGYVPWPEGEGFALRKRLNG